MIPVNGKIVMSVDSNQKNTCTIGGNTFKMPLLYETNYRFKSPVIATVVEGNELLQTGDILLCHHNLYYQPSPYWLWDDLFTVPFSKVLFCKILMDGELLPICGNILGERVVKETLFPLPQPEKCTDRIIVSNPGYTKYKKGQLLLTRPSAPYDIIYFWNGEQKAATKISDDMVTAIVK